MPVDSGAQGALERLVELRMGESEAQFERPRRLTAS